MRTIFFVICLVFSLFSCENEQVLVDATSSELELVNGVLNYKNTPFTGLLFSRFEDTSYNLKLEYLKGRKHGIEKQWYQNGNLSQSRIYAMGIKVGNHLGWWEDGAKKFDYNFNLEGDYDGNRKEWYSNGQLIRDFNYSKGNEIGMQRMWTSKGKIRANYEVKNGDRFGLIGLKKCFTVNTNSNELK